MSFNLQTVIHDWTADGLILVEQATFPDHTANAIRYRGFVLHHLSLIDQATATMQCDLYGAEMMPVARVSSISIHATDPVITTEADHGLSNGNVVFLLGDDSDHTIIWGIVADADGNSKTFTLPGVTTVAGTKGSVHKSNAICKKNREAEYPLSAGENGLGPYAAVWLDSQADNLVELLYHTV